MKASIQFGVVQNVVAINAALEEIQRRLANSANQISEPVHDAFDAVELLEVVEFRQAVQFVSIRQWSDDFLVDVIADGRFASHDDHVFEAGTVGNDEVRTFHARVRFKLAIDTFLLHELKHRQASRSINA